MNKSLLKLPLEKKRELLRARQLARQFAGLLGFDAIEQAAIAAAVFEVARQARAAAATAVLHFQVVDDVFLVQPEGVPVGTAPLRLEKPRPSSATRPAGEDLAWVVSRLVELTPFTVLEEVQRQNQELLRTVAELKACQAKLEQLTAPQTKPSAA